MKKASDFVKFRDDSLRQNFLNNMNNDAFRSLVDKLSLNQDKLYKYTSGLENSTCEFEHCMTCKGLEFCKNELKGYCNLPEDDEEGISFTYKACRFMKRSIDDNKYKENLSLFDMPKNLKDAKIKNIYTDDSLRKDAIKEVVLFLKNYENGEKKGIYLHGSFGSGKTYLIAALFNELAKKGEKSAIIYFPEFLRTLKASFQKSEMEEVSFSDKYEYIKNIPFLLIDDIGAENVTAWGRDEILGTLLQYRMNENLTTFFTSNLTIDELEVHLAATNNKTEKVKARRIIERIKCLTKDVEVVSKSLR